MTVINSTQTSVQEIPGTESFYRERFKRSVISRYSELGEVYCEIYKGFAIVNWKLTTRYTNIIYEVGGEYDRLVNLAWLSQGAVTQGFADNDFDKSLAKAKKKIDTLSLMYSIKDELIALSHIYQSSSDQVFNARVGDVVGIRAFGRKRLGKVVKTQGSRFVVAYMTPSNSLDIHFKVVPLAQIYEYERAY